MTNFSPPRQQAPGATASLVLGLFSVLGAVIVIPIVLGPLAWYHGVNAQRIIEREPTRWTGVGEARAGMILGIIGTCLLGLFLLLLAILAAGLVLAHRYDAGYGS